MKSLRNISDKTRVLIAAALCAGTLGLCGLGLYLEHRGLPRYDIDLDGRLECLCTPYDLGKALPGGMYLLESEGYLCNPKYGTSPVYVKLADGRLEETPFKYEIKGDSEGHVIKVMDGNGKVIYQRRQEFEFHPNW